MSKDKQSILRKKAYGRERAGERDARLSFLRITATLAVIWLHVNSTLADNALAFGIDEKQLSFHAAMIYFFEWAVAAFMILSGTLLLDPERRFGKGELLRSLRRLVLALLIFGVPFVACRLWLRGEVPGAGLAGKAFFYVMIGKEVGHFWYLYLLMCVYLILPMLRVFVRDASKRVRWYAVGVLFAVGSVVPQIYLEAEETMPVAAFAAFPILPLLAGYLLFHGPVKKKTLLRTGAVVVFLLCGVWTTIEALGTPYPYASGRLGFSSPQVLLMCAAAAVFFVTLPGDAGRHSRILWGFDRLCFAVYLVHPVFVQILYKYFGLIPERHPHAAAGTVLIWIAVTVLSFLAAFVLRLIPPLRKYVL